MHHPYVLELELVLNDRDLVTIHERLPVTLLNHFKGNFIGHGSNYVYVAPLFHRLMRYSQYVYAFLRCALSILPVLNQKVIEMGFRILLQ